jgi:hypothetical protein
MSRDALNRLTYEEHRELARELQRNRARLTQLFSMVAGVYGPQNWCAFAFSRVNENMDRLVLEFAGQAEADCPGTDAANFYRGLDPRPQSTS